MKNCRQRRKGVPSQDGMGITLESHHTPAPDATECLRRAYALILGAPGRAEQAKSEQPDSQKVKNDAE